MSSPRPETPPFLWYSPEAEELYHGQVLPPLPPFPAVAPAARIPPAVAPAAHAPYEIYLPLTLEQMVWCHWVLEEAWRIWPMDSVEQMMYYAPAQCQLYFQFLFSGHDVFPPNCYFY